MLTLQDQTLVTVAQAAQIAQIHIESVWRMIREGRLPVYGRPNRYRVALDDLLPRRHAPLRSAKARKADTQNQANSADRSSIPPTPKDPAAE